MSEKLSELKYPFPGELRLYDPCAPHPEDIDLKWKLRKLTKDKTQGFTYLPLFSLAVYMGFRKLGYQSQNRQDGAYFAMTADRCEAFGKSISNDLEFLCLELTCFMPGSAQFVEVGIDANCRNGVCPQVGELLFSHKSGDEATIEEAIAFARLIHKLNVRVAHLWAGEFEKGALDAIWHTLQQLENRSLSLADICDVSLSAPDDRIRHQGIESLVAENRKVSGPVSSIVGSTE